MEEPQEMKRNSCEMKVSRLLTRCDVYASDHVLWLDRHNEMHLSPIPEKETIQSWRLLNRDRIKFSLKPFPKGQGLVGPEAGQDKEWLAALCAIIDDEMSAQSESIH